MKRRWRIIADLENAPKHEEGGVQLRLGKRGGGSFGRGKSSLRAANGLVIPVKKNK